MSDSNPSARLERTSSIVYDADIFNCSRQDNDRRRKGLQCHIWTQPRSKGCLLFDVMGRRLRPGVDPLS